MKTESSIAVKGRFAIIIAVLVILAGGISYWMTRPPQSLVLTGIVATDDVRVGSLIQGRLQELLVRQGDTVQKGQLLAITQPEEWKADKVYYESTEKESAEEVKQAQADLDFLEAQTRDQIRQAQAGLARSNAEVAQAEADLEYSRLSFDRSQAMQDQKINSKEDYDKARTSYTAAKAHVESLHRQVQAAEAELALARANAKQVAARRAALAASTYQLAASRAQAEKADVLLGYTEIHAPIGGIVDVRAALQGEVVTPGQTIVSLVDPDNLWVRVDVEETYIDRIHLGDKMTVRLPSGVTREGTVFFRGVDADYATQRDVSRTKRDIKTFQVRLRCNNSDRSLALGMTAYVTLPLR